MAQRFHWLRLRATAHATEDPAKVEAALRAVGADEVESQVIDSHHGGEVLLLEATISRQAEIRRALERVKPFAAELEAQLEARMDDDGILYFRFDKQEALGEKAVLTGGGDAIQCRVKIEVHPTGRARAMAAWKAWLAA